MCAALARTGADVAVAYNRDADAARSVVDEVTAIGRRARAVQVEVADEASVCRMVEEVRAALGPVTVLVNNAGLVRRRSTLETSLAEWEELMGTNLTGPFLCVRAVLPDMLAQGRGAIVNVASMAALTGGNVGPGYPAAKGGLISLTHALARELVGKGIRVNCIAPNLVATDMLAAAGFENLDQMVAQLPQRRAAKPEEIAEVVAFLCSDRASYVSGQCIPVTGG